MKLFRKRASSLSLILNANLSRHLYVCRVNEIYKLVFIYEKNWSSLHRFLIGSKKSVHHVKNGERKGAIFELQA